MGNESLQTFLCTHPYKKIDSLRHISTSCKISSNGIGETLRNRILEHVGDDQEIETKVRDLAIKFKQEFYKNAPFPMSPTVHVLKGSTPKTRQRVNKPRNDGEPQLTDETIDLFNSQSQEENDQTPEIEDENSKSILEEIDEVEALGNEIEKSLRQNETEVKNNAGSDANDDKDDGDGDKDDNDGDKDDDDDDVADVKVEKGV